MRKKILSPPPILNLVEWADKYRYLSPESSSVPGKWKTSTVEVARGPMLEVGNPKTKIITVMACTQILKTELINNIVGYHIHQDPCPMIVMQPTKAMAETWSKERFEKMSRDTPVIADLVRIKKRGDDENTMYSKSFPGGQLNIVGSNSAAELASRPIRIVLCDEIDKYPASAGKEGDPIKLIEERTDTFWNALKVRVCSPTIEGMSRIAEEFEAGDQRIYHGKCQHCGEYEKLEWKQVRFSREWKKPDDVIDDQVNYECSHCTVLWTETERIQAINAGKYVALKPFNGHASFKVNKIASPWNALSTLVKKYLDAIGSSEKMKTFENTQLAETYKIKSDSPDHMRLYERRELYPINQVNNKALFLTAGVDVQANRLELEIVGWASNKESWSVDYRVIPGQTSTDVPWKALEEILNQSWQTEDNKRTLSIRMMCVDTGYNTQHVYNWLRKQDPNRVRGIKGSDNMQMMFGKPVPVELNHNGQRIKNALMLWHVGVSILKSELYPWLKMDAPKEGELKSGFCHFPQYDEEYFQGLCSEQLVETRKNGRNTLVWQKKFNRNEPLDTRIYARVGAAMFGLDRMTPEDAQHLLYETNRKDVTNKRIIDTEESDDNEFWDRNKRGRGVF